MRAGRAVAARPRQLARRRTGGDHFAAGGHRRRGRELQAPLRRRRQLVVEGDPEPRPHPSASHSRPSHVRRSRMLPGMPRPTSSSSRCARSARGSSFPSGTTAAASTSRRRAPGNARRQRHATRIALLGGELQGESAPGGPTTVTATLQPWRPAARRCRAPSNRKRYRGRGRDQHQRLVATPLLTMPFGSLSDEYLVGGAAAVGISSGPSRVRTSSQPT